MSRTILFLCPHNAAKSVIAVAYARHLVDRYGLDLTITSAGTDPDAAIWPSVIDMLQADGIEVADEKPRQVTQQDLAGAARIISLGCAAAELEVEPNRIEHWNDVPPASEDLSGSRDAIRTHVAALIDEFRG